MSFWEQIIYTGAIPLVAAGIGGGITAFATCLSTKRNHKNNLELWNKNEKINEQILISSLQTELSELRKLLEREFDEKLIKDNSYKFEITFPEGTDYFTVFNTSASQLGRIKNDELRSKIITTYIEAKFFYDSLKTNTKILEERAKISLNIVNSPADSDVRTRLPKVLERLENALKLSKFDNLIPSYKRLFILFSEIDNLIKNKALL